jgi:hypothetical protein
MCLNGHIHSISRYYGNIPYRSIQHQGFIVMSKFKTVTMDQVNLHHTRISNLTAQTMQLLAGLQLRSIMVSWYITVIHSQICCAYAVAQSIYVKTAMPIQLLSYCHTAHSYLLFHQKLVFPHGKCQYSKNGVPSVCSR